VSHFARKKTHNEFQNNPSDTASTQTSNSLPIILLTYLRNYMMPYSSIPSIVTLLIAISTMTVSATPLLKSISRIEARKISDDGLPNELFWIKVWTSPSMAGISGLMKSNETCVDFANGTPDPADKFW
jgi:hypothetical protein